MSMKNLESLKGKAIKLSKDDLKSVNGGMRWTNDRGGCVEDRRSTGLYIQSIASMPLHCITDAYNPGRYN